MSGTVAVIDYGMGNLHSVASALQHAGADETAGWIVWIYLTERSGSLAKDCARNPVSG